MTMTTMALQLIEKRAKHLKGDTTNAGLLYAEDVPKLLEEIERLRDENNKLMWRLA